MYISRIGAELKAKNLSISELRRRLAQREVPVSRGALDRLSSGRPIESISLSVVVPILQELVNQLRGRRFADDVFFATVTAEPSSEPLAGVPSRSDDT